MITPEKYLRTPVQSESREARELRQYARTELNSGTKCLTIECEEERRKKNIFADGRVTDKSPRRAWFTHPVNLMPLGRHSVKWLNFK